MFTEQGAARFGFAVAQRTLERIDRAIDHQLAHNPTRLVDADLGLHVYYVWRTPFTLLYDFDDTELRIHFIVPARMDRTRIDPTAVEW